jgi:hypothetical protein
VNYPLRKGTAVDALAATETARNLSRNIVWGMRFTEVPRAAVRIEEEDTPESVQEILNMMSQLDNDPYHSEYQCMLRQQQPGMAELIDQPEEEDDRGLLQDSERVSGYQLSLTDTGFKLPPVFAYEELEQLNQQSHNVIAPAWVPRIPSEFGSAKAGKLKADEWRFMILVHAPLILTSIWAGNPSRSLHLKNLLYLSIAAKIAASRVISNDSIALYQRMIRLYLKTLAVVAPTYKPVISHHLCLHIDDQLKLHGPSPTHWQFPTERAIGTLGSLAHNFDMSESKISVFNEE